MAEVDNPHHSVVRNKGGREYVVRPARPEDRAALERMFRCCSAETLYTRFLSPGLGVPLRYLDRLMLHQPPRIVSLVTEQCGCDPPELVGLMNFVHSEPGPGAEIAIVVADSQQNQGLGKAMVRCLLELAHEQGVGKIIADIDAGNRRVFHMIQTSGAPSRITIDQGVAHVEMDVTKLT